jgi:hypothetical protein
MTPPLAKEVSTVDIHNMNVRISSWPKSQLIIWIYVIWIYFKTKNVYTIWIFTGSYIAEYLLYEIHINYIYCKEI